MADHANSTPTPAVHPPTGIVALTAVPLTMSTREIAELTDKRHDNVMRDTRAMLEEMAEGGILKFEDTYRNEQNGQDYPIFRLPKRECLILVSGYDLGLRTRIIDRWMELEKALAARPAMELPAAPVALLSPRAALSTFKAYSAFGKLIGLDKNQAILAANRATRKTTGVDLLADLEVPHLLAPHQETLMTVTELGMKLGGKSARATNLALTRHGFQAATRDPKGEIHYEATDLGRPYSRMLDVDKAQGAGAPVLQLRWLTTVVGPLAEAIGGEIL